ncbi:MAG: hypothetical protein EXQ88_06965 [Alphaproteobacteria bacterium]|nr:hypothetical protein [Alphaproteobacteria bacterium]
MPTLAKLLGGCALSGVSIAPVHRLNAHNDYDMAAAAGDFTTIVVGNPFGGDNAAFARLVTTILNEENSLQRSNFTTQPGQNALKQYRVVFVFNAARLDDQTLCGDPPTLRGGPTGTAPITVQAAFCNGAVATVGVYGSVSSGEENKFRALITQVQIALFPGRTALSALTP